MVSEFVTHANLAIQYTFYIFPIVTTVFGTIGNLFSFLIFLDKRFWSTPMGFYNAYVAIIGILIQYLGSLKYFFQVVTANPQNTSIIWCKILTYTIRPLDEIAAWIQLTITLDRYISVKYPQRFQFFRKRWFQTLIISIITIAFFMYQIPVAVTYGYYDQSTNSTKLVCFTKYIAVFILNDTGLLVLYCIIPFTVMLYLTISLSIHLIRSKKKLKLSGKNKKEYQFAFLTIIQNIVFFVMSLPICTLWPVLSVKTAGLLGETYEQGVLLALLSALFNAIIYTYFAIPFLINYCCNKLFRKIALDYACRFKGNKSNSDSTVFSITK